MIQPILALIFYKITWKEVFLIFLPIFVYNLSFWIFSSPIILQIVYDENIYVKVYIMMAIPIIFVMNVVSYYGVFLALYCWAQENVRKGIIFSVYDKNELDIE